MSPSNRILEVVVSALLVAWTGLASATVAGVFQFVSGEVQVLSVSGASKPARKGTPLSVGETVLSERTGTAQIKMGDGAVVVVQPGSRLSVLEFHFDGREDGSEKVTYRLEQGGFRAITGAIGRTHKQNYLIETPIAQMGVRGTDHESYYFSTPQPANGGVIEPGVYNKVNVGLVYIRTQAGEVVVAPNQVGYAASAMQAPSILPAIPGFFNRTLGPGRRSSLEPPPAATDEALKPKVTQVVLTSGAVNLTDPMGGSGASSGGGGTSVSGGAGSVFGFDPQAGGAAAARSGVNLSVASNGAPIVNAGSDAAAGIDWGTWTGGLATVAGNATVGSTHFINAAQLTTAAQLAAMPATIVNATYSYAGGPPPTNQAGAQGAINALTVGVNFGSQQITGYNVNATVGAANWNAAGSGSIAQFSGAQGIALSGSCSGCAGGGTPTASGTAHGVFVGAAAEKMISGFGLKAASQSVSGTALLAR